MKSLESLRAKRAAIIYNPVARGLLRRQHLLQRSITALQEQGLETKLVGTAGPCTAGVQARTEIERGCDLIAVVGGDGTINEVADGMLHTGVPLAVIPGGTANVLAREMRIPIHMERAALQISRMRQVRIAVGRLRSFETEARSFVCMAGVGLDAEIVSNLNLGMKAALGKLAYYLGGFAQVFRPLPEFEVTVDGRPYEASFALISRVRNYGGDLEIARGASLLRPDFEVVLFRGTMSFQYLPYLVGVTLGYAQKMKGVTVLRGHSITCQRAPAQPVYVQLDGELAGSLPAAVDILPEALTLLVPPEYIVREQQYHAVPVCA